MRAMVLLAMLPFAVFATNIGVHYPPKPAPHGNDYVAVAVTTEGVRRVPLDTRTFSARWLPVHQMPLMQFAGRKPGEATPLPEPRPQVLPRQPIRPNIRRGESPHRREKATCTRHRMRTVWVTPKRWRCKR